MVIERYNKNKIEKENFEYKNLKIFCVLKYLPVEYISFPQ